MGIYDPNRLNALAADPLRPYQNNPFLNEKTNALANFLTGYVPPPPPLPASNNPLGGLNALQLEPFSGLGSNALAPLGGLGSFGMLAPQVKRRAYFAFKFDDVMRVNNVRQAWKIDHPDSRLMRSFYDSSLWESKKLESDDSLKQLMRKGVAYTSAVCVLIGTETWSSRWVKYEIARSVIDGRGLLAVHLNGLNHHQRRQPDPLGFNPLHLMGVYKSPTGKFYLYEKREVTINRLSAKTEWQWLQYQDYTLAVPLPRYLAEPWVEYIMPLSWHTAEYNYATQDGHKNIGAWIDHSAQAAGR